METLFLRRVVTIGPAIWQDSARTRRGTRHIREDDLLGRSRNHGGDRRLPPARAGDALPHRRILLAMMVLAACPPIAFAQSPGLKAGSPPWTDAPVRVDRGLQAYPRIEASPVSAPTEESNRLRFSDKAHFKILDSVSFAEGGRTYRLAGLEPVPSAKICKSRDGARWACGLRARAALDELLIGRMMRCSAKGAAADVMLVECDRGGKDIGGLLVSGGHAVVAKGAAVYDRELAEANAAKAGVWGDVTTTQ